MAALTQSTAANLRRSPSGFAAAALRTVRRLCPVFGPWAATIVIAAILCRQTAVAAPTLVWDALAKTAAVAPGATQATFSFTATNVSGSDVVLTSVSTSCRCTRAVLPSIPYTIAPRGSVVLQVVVALTSDPADVSQTVFVESTAGACHLDVKVTRADARKAGGHRRGGGAVP